MTATYLVGISADLRGQIEPQLEEHFGPLPAVAYEFIAEDVAEFAPAQLQRYDAVISLFGRYTPASFRGVERLAAIARWGVGYDMVDVPAATEADVLLAITRDAVRRPVAEGIVALLLALTRHMLAKDRLVRAGRWAEKDRYPGIGLAGRTIGSVGLGNIGAELARLLKPFDLSRFLAFDPYLGAEQAAAIGVELVPLEVLLAEADFVCVNCPLTPQTRHLLNAERIGLMKPTALLINTARGPIVDQAALTEALREGRIAGAGLDVFEQEPLPADDPLTRMENVILAPHAIAWTDELVRENGAGACRHVLDVLRGEVPRHTVNREVASRPRFQAKLAALRARWKESS
jgi:phosphoglycerate dehydrogenase-like enzyme